MADYQSSNNDTIAAVATAAGRGGIGIIRLSGPQSVSISEKILKTSLTPRYAYYGDFHETETAQIIDQGISLYFPKPHSFTGEDVIEFQAHGGPIVLDILLNQVLKAGARLAHPGEFSERAFLNDKMDLVQAEAIADLIDSNSEQAARCAIRSLQGEFSEAIHALVKNVTSLRVYVEAAIDFPEEEVDFLTEGNVKNRLDSLQVELDDVLSRATQGSILREGINVVIAGRPNAGKSSLLNALVEKDAAIVTSIEGTTRDILKEQITIDGMPLHIIDTAGLRESDDEVETIGIHRAWQAINDADQILFLVDAQTTSSCDPTEIWPEFVDKLPSLKRVTLVRNKIDTTNEQASIETSTGNTVIRLSAKEKLGLDFLKTHLKEIAGYNSSIEGGFIARRRHIDALNRARQSLEAGSTQLALTHSGELLAEDLRMVQQSLGEITGEVTPDDLLGEIFSSFCIGK
jgi:tRNA modification GTPase